VSAMLKNGGIVAIKGLGGFHLACDAANDFAVRTLRERKRRSNKPFAVMASDANAVRRFCEVGEQRAAPAGVGPPSIVLLKKRTDARRRRCPVGVRIAGEQLHRLHAALYAAPCAVVPA